MIYFYDIFEIAIHLFDDPDISRKYYQDKAAFQPVMRDYLMIGRKKFNRPTAICNKLTEMDAPEGYLESGDGDGSKEITLDAEHNPSAYPEDKVGFTFAVDGKPVCAKYDPSTNKVTFGDPIPQGSTWTVGWFYAGAFTADFSKCFRSDYDMEAIMEEITTILAYALVTAWADQEVGRVIEVRNILTDHDFKMYSPANSARAKTEWRNQMNRDMDTLVSSLNWSIMAMPKGGSRFGQ